MRLFFLFFFTFILPLINANISGYGEVAGEGPAAAAPAAAPPPECDDSTSEAKANGPNPFCVYPALVGDHPSSGKRPGETNSVDIPPGVNAFGEASPVASEEPAPPPPESAPAAPAPSAPAPAASSSYSKSAARIRASRRK